MASAVLAARGLCKRYGARVVVDDLSLTVEAGDVYGFLGPNGAGKTTTLRMMVGLVRPSAGEVMVLGQPLTSRRRGALARVGAIIESPSFYPYLSGRDNLRMLADLTGPCPRTRIDEVLERVGLRDRAGDRAQVYSHGMKQRLAIAAALLPRPELIILDEPTNGLDPMGIRSMRELVRGLARDDGLTVLLSSHLLVEVEQVASRGCILVAGRKLWEGEVSDLLAARRRIRLIAEPRDVAARVVTEVVGTPPRLDDDGVLWATVDSAADDVTAELVARLVGAGCRVTEVVAETPTLEEVFMELVDRHHGDAGDRARGDGAHDGEGRAAGAPVREVAS